MIIIVIATATRLSSNVMITQLAGSFGDKRSSRTGTSFQCLVAARLVSFLPKWYLPLFVFVSFWLVEWVGGWVG